QLRPGSLGADIKGIRDRMGVGSRRGWKGPQFFARTIFLLTRLLALMAFVTAVGQQSPGGRVSRCPALWGPIAPHMSSKLFREKVNRRILRQTFETRTPLIYRPPCFVSKLTVYETTDLGQHTQRGLK